MGKSMAMCPQWNAVWGKLTVDESLQFVARLKGLNDLDFESNKKFIIETLEL
jgi:ABC-type multidrug transport system ATPase subunit